MLDKSNRQIKSFSICGFEDVRFCFGPDPLTSGTLLLSCTSADSEVHGVPETVVATYDINTNSIIKTAIHHHVTTTPNRKKKIRLPFLKDNGSGKSELHYIYKQNPLTIHKMNEDHNGFTIVSQKSSPSVANHFRGSAGPISFEIDGTDGYLYMVHEVSYSPTWVYKHRFVWMNGDFDNEIAVGQFFFVQSRDRICLWNGDGSQWH